MATVGFDANKLATSNMRVGLRILELARRRVTAMLQR